MSDEAKFLEALPVIDDVTAQVCRRNRLNATESDEFRSDVRLHFIERNYEVLRKFEGRCALATYVNVVVQRVFFDWRNRMWGRWRPSTEARRLGPAAILLERLVTRDGWTLDQAIETARVNHKVEIDDTLLQVLQHIRGAHARAPPGFGGGRRGSGEPGSDGRGQSRIGGAGLPGQARAVGARSRAAGVAADGATDSEDAVRGSRRGGGHRARAASGSASVVSHARTFAEDRRRHHESGRHFARGHTALFDAPSIEWSERSGRRPAAAGKRNWPCRTKGVAVASEPMKVNGGTCPSLETIGAFVDGRLMDRERETIADHVASCEACYFVFSEAARTQVKTQKKGDVVPFPPRRMTWRIAAGLAAAAMILLAVNVSVPVRRER